MIQTKVLLACLFFWLLLLPAGTCAQSNLAGKIICLDPGHGGTAATDSFRQGITGEREEWINLRVALLLKEMLEKKGAKVWITRTDDSNISFDDRINLAVDNKADVFLSIHHNGTADRSVNFPIVYFHGNASENVASVELGKAVAKHLKQFLYGGKTPVSVVSDHTIFPTAGTKVLRGTYGIPGIIAEASFFTNAVEEKRLKSKHHNEKEAQAFVKALEEYFSASHPPIAEKNSQVQLTPFAAFQEAERMNPVALQWKADFEEGKKLFRKGDSISLTQAMELFTRSAKSFPDSYVAAQCHSYRATILQKLGKAEEARHEEVRVKERYVMNNE
ncbi:N-acetylmuramoyl-L-alanine amidase [Rhodocytophaga aerolata]|uniref:N-acetylmuramoyl-L-alanine amidase n=1 Tax=Rhodocytophaga aerolata TaxID=455078 RepID=A0ABT8R1N5_9BACT|nr:N-acetylmuramoyl-L-alanine amidase [Rhodocytophaga aerolata]MDO1445299.1 N-acetylmuramoyl-L-alanine amidase [Rhodocytophaga aerolata]